MNFFVTGTDTEVGKTYVTALLTKALRKAGFDTVALKPICCGPRDDVDMLREASDHELSAEDMNPCWLEAAAAPLVAARKEGREVDVAALTEWFKAHRARRKSLLVEGAGGWLVPLTAKETVADLAAAFGLPVLLVVANRLGCLNHTLLTLESIRARGLTCGGLVLNTLTLENSVATATNRKILEELSGAPILFEIGPNQPTIDLAVA